MNTIAVTEKSIDEAFIHHMIQVRQRAICHKDVETIISQYVPNVSSLDLYKPQQGTSIHTIKSQMLKWFAGYIDTVPYKSSGLEIIVGDNIAFSHCLTSALGLINQHTKNNLWCRTTMCYQKINGNWLITHEHNSEPFSTVASVPVSQLPY
jgi:ketosteroid isomerase-like protein